MRLVGRFDDRGGTGHLREEAGVLGILLLLANKLAREAFYAGVAFAGSTSKRAGGVGDFAAEELEGFFVVEVGGGQAFFAAGRNARASLVLPKLRPGGGQQSSTVLCSELQFCHKMHGPCVLAEGKTVERDHKIEHA